MLTDIENLGWTTGTTCIKPDLCLKSLRVHESGNMQDTWSALYTLVFVIQLSHCEKKYARTHKPNDSAVVSEVAKHVPIPTVTTQLCRFATFSVCSFSERTQHI